MKSTDATDSKLKARMSQTVRLSMCGHPNLQSLETYDKIARRLLKDVRYELFGEYIVR